MKIIEGGFIKLENRLGVEGTSRTVWICSARVAPGRLCRELSSTPLCHVWLGCPVYPGGQWQPQMNRFGRRLEGVGIVAHIQFAAAKKELGLVELQLLGRACQLSYADGPSCLSSQFPTSLKDLGLSKHSGNCLFQQRKMIPLHRSMSRLL